MRKQVIGAGLAAVALGLAGEPAGAQGGASFAGLGIAAEDAGSRGNDVSADGSVVAGNADDGFLLQALRWDATSGPVRLPEAPPSNRIAIGVSDDGATITGVTLLRDEASQITGREAFRWTAVEGVVPLGDLAGGALNSDAYAASADGSIVVGTGADAEGRKAVYWDAGGIHPIGDVPGGTVETEATGVSADGSLVAGYGVGALGVEAFWWTEAAGIVPLGELPGGEVYSLANGVSADGRVIVGASSDADGARAVRWLDGGAPQALGQVAGAGVESTATAASADGARIVGVVYGPPDDVAFVWDAAHGMRDLKAVLEEDHGLDLGIWALTYAASISADGRTIVGAGMNPDGATEGFVAFLPEPGAGALGAAALATLSTCARRRRALIRRPA